MPAVATVHDLLHLHYYSRLHIEYYKRILKPLYRKCSGIICVSEFTRREFLAWSQFPAEQVITIHNGIDQEAFASAPPARLPYPYVFYAGNRRVYKNLYRLLEAYARSRLPKEGVHLVLTGPPDADLGQWATALGIDQLLHFAGKLADSEVRGLYRGATAVAFVSLYEGFGLPVLEGMAAGVPVMTSSTAAMPEVAGNAALLVDPKSTDEIANGLGRLCFDEALRAALINSGRARAAIFSWDTCAARTWQVIERAAGGAHR
jgi:glycosyltransferase involved in cell wall biosynthesis